MLKMNIMRLKKFTIFYKAIPDVIVGNSVFNLVKIWKSVIEFDLLRSNFTCAQFFNHIVISR